MPHEKTRNSLLSNSCHFSLDRRRALTLSPEIKRDSCQVCPCMKWHDILNSGVYCVSMFLHKHYILMCPRLEVLLRSPRDYPQLRMSVWIQRCQKIGIRATPRWLWCGHIVCASVDILYLRSSKEPHLNHKSIIIIVISCLIAFIKQCIQQYDKIHQCSMKSYAC